MSDAIAPPLASRPDEVCRLVSAALSDGDLDAALVHYEPDAVTSPGGGPTVRGRAELRRLLAAAAAARLLYTVDVDRVLDAGDLALVHGTWHSSGSGERRSGGYWSVVRRSAENTWRIAAEAIVAEEEVQ
jgi:ketosteroid isomerase-like protein